MGYDELGTAGNVSVDAREFRGTGGNVVRGLVVEVDESQYRTERSFVDAHEIPELIRGIDALLAVSANPTPFKNFEVRYTTKGELRFTAFNSSGGAISYSVEVGRVIKAHRFIEVGEMRQLREFFIAAQQKLSSR
jgi:hypothetical protein